MIKIGIFSQNESFANDLAEQINLFKADAQGAVNELQADITIIDEDENKLIELAIQHKELPLVFLSQNQEKPAHADTVIKKPFNLHEFLLSLKNKTLLPKVRYKECLIFKEYSLYPIKKEIISAATGITTKLTEKEVEILKYLYQVSPEIAGKDALLENVWKYSADAATHTIETHIYRLRQKVEQNGNSQLIITENNGYRLNI